MRSLFIFTCVGAEFTPLQIDLFLSRHVGWSQWSAWKPCETVKCGKATTSRIRLCRTKYSELCPGKSIEELDCPNTKELAPCHCFKPNEQPGYLGSESRTVSGRICQPWSFQFPHKHNRTPDNFPHAGLEANFCRNPDPSSEDQGRPWCYTSDPDVTWEYCDVEKCQRLEINLWEKILSWLFYLVTTNLNSTRDRTKTHSCNN